MSGISTLNSSLTSLASQLGATQQLEANSLIGQGVLTAGSNITVTNTTDSSGKTTQVASPAGVQISGPTSDLTVTIKDASGNIVQKIDLGPQQSAGVVPFEWNGQNSSGAAVPNGNYTYTAAAADSGVTATALTFGVVQGVTADPSGSGTDVTLNNGSNVPLSAIVETL
ncbi:MAG: FlgD immunoglobulin-like domain containing protein [Pararobbsia sp.]